MSEGAKRSIKNKNAAKARQKVVAQLDDNGNVIRIWESIRIACKAIGCYTGNVNKVLKGKLNKTGGFGWKYA